MPKCAQRLESNRQCEAPVYSGRNRCWWHAVGKPNAERWHADRNARLSMMGQQQRRDAPLNTERWR